MGDAVKIMYVCDCCADECPENCGHYDPAEVRRSPSGWLCEVCYDEEREEDAPVFSDLPVAAPPEPTDAEVEAAAEFLMGDLSWCKWGDAEEGAREIYRNLARAALIAARKARA